MIKHACVSCGVHVDVVTLNEGYCVRCLGLVRKHQEIIFLARLRSKKRAEERFLEMNKDRKLECRTCGSTKRLKDAYESNWKLVQGEIICQNCLKTS